MLERFSADVVYSEAGVGCGGVGGAMSVGFVSVVSASTDSVSRTSVLKQGEQLVRVKYIMK